MVDVDVTMHYYVNSPSKNQRSKNMSSMDKYLSTLGLWRKPVARDGYCLFRATSEQIYFTQAHYNKLYEVSKQFFYRLDGIEEDYVWTESDAMFSLSVICRCNFLVYESPGLPPYLAIDNCFSENVMLCRIDSTHLESVFPKTFIQKLALCQSIVYEILYKGVYQFTEEEIKEAVGIIREQEGKRKRNTSSCSPDSSCSSSSGSTGELSPVLYTNKLDENNIFIIKPPVPFRIAKALDPLIYRNTELDIWEEDKREARHKAIVYCPGDKCMIVSEEGKKLYHGHIQEVFDNREVVTAFIEELGERKEIQVDRLRPDKTSKTSSIIKHWQRRRMKAMTVEGAPPRMTQPPALPPPEKPSLPVSQTVNMPPPPPPPITQMAVPIQPPPTVFHQPPMVAFNGPITESQPPPQMNIPVACMGIEGQLPPFPPNMMNGAMMAYNPENGIMGLGDNMSNPVVYVPYMETIIPSEVNVDYPPSEDSRGLDLPLNDINTLRFFFNLGVSHYRTVSLFSHTMAAGQTGLTNGQSPVVYCQSTPDTRLKTSPSNGVDFYPVLSTLIQPTVSSRDNENDDRSSNVSNDSGCEAENVSKGNGKSEGDRESVQHGSSGVNETHERNSNSSDMSISDTVGSPPPEIDTSTDQGYKTHVKRRKYFMYKNLKLIKPIKEIPTKYLDLLKYLSLEKSRCEGEPIILAPTNIPQTIGNPVSTPISNTPCNSCQVNLNPTAQSFVPGKGPNPVVPNSCSLSTVNSNHKSMPPPSSPVHNASSHVRLPNMPKPFVSPMPPHNISFSHYHTIPFHTGQ